MTALGRSPLLRGPAAVGNRAITLLRSTPRGLPTLASRRPRVTVRTGASVPAWLPRVLGAAIAVAGVRLAGAGDTLTVLGVLLALLLLVRSGGAAPVLVLAFTGLVLATSGDSGWRPEAFAVLLGTHLVAHLGALLGRSTWHARVELRALLVGAPRFLLVQLAAQLVAVLAAVLTRGRLELPWLGVLAVLGLAGLVLVLAPRLASPPAPLERHV
ncbi:hypothetical protein [uncultured Friedmanniella sp.]|uniref:hypothetical protein n=1 Tax=uncultured Friedmanniella sp. TaxID=335381 RepID=UPI0035CA84C5